MVAFKTRGRRCFETSLILQAGCLLLRLRLLLMLARAEQTMTLKHIFQKNAIEFETRDTSNEQRDTSNEQRR